MGTLFSQSERYYRFIDDSDLYGAVACIKQIAERADITFDQALEVWRLLEQKRATDVHVDDRDRWDEQIAGIGEILDRIATTMHEASASAVAEWHSTLIEGLKQNKVRELRERRRKILDAVSAQLPDDWRSDPAAYDPGTGDVTQTARELDKLEAKLYSLCPNWRTAE